MRGRVRDSREEGGSSRGSLSKSKVDDVIDEAVSREGEVKGNRRGTTSETSVLYKFSLFEI